MVCQNVMEAVAEPRKVIVDEERVASLTLRIFGFSNLIDLREV